MNGSIIVRFDRLTGLLEPLRRLSAGVLRLLFRPARPAQPEPQPADLPTRHFVTIDGVTLHFLDTGGRNPPLVLLHGNGGMIADMEISGLAELAARRYRVIVFDRPGYGLSERPRRIMWTPELQAGLIHKACLALGVESPIVLGHSWGALVSLAMALDHRDAVAGLVLASGFYFPTPRIDVLLFAPPAIPVVGDIMRHTILIPLARAIAPSVIRKIFAPQTVAARFTEQFPMDVALRSSQIRSSAEEAMLMLPAAARLSKRYGKLRIPVFIIAGARDEIVDTDSQSLRLHAAIPGSDLKILPELGHMIHYFAPAEIVAAIDFVAVNISGSVRRAVPAL
jgi:pimeloyl-ACP methyl ester carboxylesterase